MTRAFIVKHDFLTGDLTSNISVWLRKQHAQNRLETRFNLTKKESLALMNEFSKLKISAEREGVLRVKYPRIYCAALA